MATNSGEPDINQTSKRLTMGSIGSFYYEGGGPSTAQPSRTNPT